MHVCVYSNSQDQVALIIISPYDSHCAWRPEGVQNQDAIHFLVYERKTDRASWPTGQPFVYLLDGATSSSDPTSTERPQRTDRSSPTEYRRRPIDAQSISLPYLLPIKGQHLSHAKRSSFSSTEQPGQVVRRRVAPQPIAMPTPCTSCLP